jgi:hypothetical protein
LARGHLSWRGRLSGIRWVPMAAHQRRTGAVIPMPRGERSTQVERRLRVRLGTSSRHLAVCHWNPWIPWRCRCGASANSMWSHRWPAWPQSQETSGVDREESCWRTIKHLQKASLGNGWSDSARLACRILTINEDLRLCHAEKHTIIGFPADAVERIRDKIAASMKKGYWIGGAPPPGQGSF